MSEVMKTENHSIFKRCEFNRDKSEGHIKRLLFSIQSNNLLEYQPILVNGDMEVLDGQHRLECAKRLGIPIYYQISQEAQNDVIPLLNNFVEKWSLLQFFEYWLKKGREEYIKAKEFMDRTGLPTQQAFSFVCYNQSSRHTIKAGTYKFNADFSIETFDVYKQFIEQMKEYLPVHKRPFFNNRLFQRSVVMFLEREDIEHEYLLKKNPSCFSLVVQKNNLSDYADMWQEVYDYRRREAKARAPVDDSADLPLFSMGAPVRSS